jgi:hypothetical protein
MNVIPEILKKLILLMIRIYQKLFSFDHSFWAKPEKIRICIFHPSCSEYTYQAIQRFGIIKGSLLGLYRIIRCNPFSKGGVDEVPDKFSFKKTKGLTDSTSSD